jgi:hypothetical protein
MPSIALSGADTVSLNNHVFADFAEGNIAELTYPNEIANVKTGKNGNSIYSLNESGRQAEFKLRLLRGSADDKFMLNLLVQQQNNFANTVLLIGQFVKKIGNGKGQITSDTYICSGGIFTKIPEAKSNVDGEAEQSVVVYTVKFSNAPRTLT